MKYPCLPKAHSDSYREQITKLDKPYFDKLSTSMTIKTII